MRIGIDKNLKWNENICVPSLSREYEEADNPQLLKQNLAWPKKTVKLENFQRPQNKTLASSKLGTVLHKKVNSVPYCDVPVENKRQKESDIDSLEKVFSFELSPIQQFLGNIDNGEEFQVNDENTYKSSLIHSYDFSKLQHSHSGNKINRQIKQNRKYSQKNPETKQILYLKNITHGNDQEKKNNYQISTELNSIDSKINLDKRYLIQLNKKDRHLHKIQGQNSKLLYCNQMSLSPEKSTNKLTKCGLKRLLSSQEFSLIHEHFYSSPAASKPICHSPSPSKLGVKKTWSIDVSNSCHTLIPLTPTFLASKKTTRLLSINEIISLKVLSENQNAMASFFVLKLLVDNDTTSVYLVREIQTNFIFCLKKCQIRKDPIEFQFLIREGKVGSKLDHPLLMKTYCTLYDKQNIYQIMQYMECSTLYEKTHKQRCQIAKKESRSNEFTSKCGSDGSQKIKSIKLILSSVLEAVSHLHKSGVLHRDIKPSNIFISHKNIIKLGDFGSSGFLKSKEYVGTLDYVAPEVLTRLSCDFVIDIWSIGCLAYELWTGGPPFYHDEREQTILNIIQNDFNRSQVNNLELLSLISNFLQKDPTKRMSAAEALMHPFFASTHKHFQ